MMPDAAVVLPKTFDMTFSGTAYTPHDGQKLTVRVTDANGMVVKNDSVVVANGAFMFSWPGLLTRNHNYEVRWVADMNNNMICNDPPLDHTYLRVIVSVTSDQMLNHVHDTVFVPSCALLGDFPLTFTGSDWTEHNGQTVRVAVIDTADNTVVARGMTNVANATFTVSWPKVLVTGRSYNLRFYADVDANMMCNAATDHAWEVSLGMATAAKMFAFPHDTNTMDICATFP